MGGCNAAPWGRGRGQVFFVNTDVKAGLLELLFHIDLAFLNERQKVAAHPCDFCAGETAFGEINGLAGKVG